MAGTNTAVRSLKEWESAPTPALHFGGNRVVQLGVEALAGLACSRSNEGANKNVPWNNSKVFELEPFAASMIVGL